MDIVLYPIYCVGESDCRLLEQLCKLGYGWVEGKALADQGLCRAVVLTDDDEVARMAREDKIETYTDTSPPQSTNSSTLSPGFAIALDWAKGVCSHTDHTQALALIDYRSPDISREQILGILAQSRQTPGVWIGLFEPEDHPAQCKIYLENLAVELHMLSDMHCEPFPNIRISRPFAIWQNSLAEDEREGYVCIAPEALAAGFEPIAYKQAAQEAGMIRGIVLESSKNGMGRRMIGSKTGWPDNSLIPFGGCLDESGLLVEVNENLTFELYTRPLQADLYRVTALGVADGAVKDTQCWSEFVSLTGYEPVVKTVCGQPYIGPLCQIPLRGPCDGVCVALERQVMAGHADRSLSLDMEGACWRDGMERGLVNLLTYQSIKGRQDFPPVLEFDGSLIAMQASSLSLLDSPNWLDNTHAYPLPSRSWIGKAVLLGIELDFSEQRERCPK